jgi:dTDP-4-dehydrorhamnose reductase
MKLLGTGLSGMVGTHITRILNDTYEFENLSLETGIDITNKEMVFDYVQKSDSPWVLHFAAKTDVDGAEKERDLGEQSPTWIVNVKATKILVDACKTFGKKLLYISTDFVFPGGERVFTEEDTPQPIGWYAQTKFQGEKCVYVLGDQGLVVRISFPYGAVDSPRPDFVQKIISRLASNREVVSPVDQIFTPTYLDDIAQGIHLLLQANASGVYHLVGSQSLSSFNAAVAIAQVFGFSQSLITKTTVSEFYKDRSPRAFHLTISNDKIKKLGISPIDFVTGLRLLRDLKQNTLIGKEYI